MIVIIISSLAPTGSERGWEGCGERGTELEQIFAHPSASHFLRISPHLSSAGATGDLKTKGKPYTDTQEKEISSLGVALFRGLQHNDNGLCMCLC